MIAKTPKAPYFAVIFSAIKNNNINEQLYSEMAQNMHTLAKESEGFLGFESAQEDLEISVSYWNSLEAIKIWSQNGFHMNAKKFGKEEVYKCYHVRQWVIRMIKLIRGTAK